MKQDNHSNKKLDAFSYFLKSPAHLLVAAFLLGFMGSANAAPLTNPPGFLPDSGASYFSHGDAILTFEGIDLLSPNVTFGFYFQGSPLALNPIFDQSDTGINEMAQINFIVDTLFDADTGAEYSFVETSPNFGLYISSGTSVLYSDPLLNSGLDVFSAFQNVASPLAWLLVFEAPINGSLFATNSATMSPITAVSAVPLPPTVLLMGSMLPILLFMSRRRKKG